MDLLALCFSLWLALSQSEQTVLLFETGRIEAVAPAPSRPASQRLEGLAAAWAWSAISAPRRLAAESYRGRRIVLSPSPDKSVFVEVSAAPGATLAELRLIAAPIDMWREVPEPLLPSWPVPGSGWLQVPVDASHPVRLRLAGSSAGSWWTELPAGRRRARLVATKAAPLVVAIEGPDGEDLESADLHVFAGAPGTRQTRWLAFHRSEARQGLTIQGLPDFAELTWVAGDRDHSLLVVRSLPSQLPPRLQLAAGSRLTGRFVDHRGLGIGGVEVRFTAWVDAAAPLPFGHVETTKRDGSFTLKGAPSGQAVLYAEKEGFAPLRQLVEVDKPVVDLGSLHLTKGDAVVILVVAEEAGPIGGAEVSPDPGNPVFTDQNGKAVLAHVAPGTLALRVQARGFLPTNRSLSVPAESDPVTIELARAFVVTGRFLDSRRSPLLDAFVRIERGSRSWMGTLSPSGAFELLLEPAAQHVLTFAAPSSGSLRLTVAAGEPGEARDLGDLSAPDGSAITGRLVDADTQEPVAGGRIWAPRSSELGPLLAWMDGDLVEATSHADGTFSLSGAALGPNALRIDAPGYARFQRAFQIAGPPAIIDLGDIPLVRGATVRVAAAPNAGQGAIAQIDPGGQGLEFDLLTAPVEGGSAVVERVPYGRASLSIVRGKTILCERQIQVPAGASEVVTECTAEGIIVRGTVSSGSKRAGPGLLVWMPEPGGLPEGVNTYVLPGGLRQQHAVTSGKPQVNVRVSEAGRFESRDLRPGRWEVSWYPESGGASQAQTILLAAASEQSVSLSFAGLAVQGVVLDGEGKSVARARVRETQSGGTTFTLEDGSFSFGGLREATYFFEALAGEFSSDTVPVTLAADQPSEPLTLVLKDPAHRPALSVRVVDSEGAGIASAFAFLEGPSLGLQVLTADATGAASFLLRPPYPEVVRAAAFAQGRWALGEWSRLADLGEGMTIQLKDTGALLVASRTAAEDVRVVGPGGWDVSLLSRFLGLLPTLNPGQPIELHGLPPGDYYIELNKVSKRGTVRAGEVSELRFD